MIYISVRDLKKIILENRFDFKYISDWDLLRLSLKHGNSFLNENNNQRLTYLKESFFSGIINLSLFIKDIKLYKSVYPYINEGILDGISNIASTIKKKFIEVSSDIKDSIVKILISALEKIPYGREIFELLKNFSIDAVSDISNSVSSAVDGLKNNFLNIKDNIVNTIFNSQIIKELSSEISKVFSNLGIETSPESFFQSIINAKIPTARNVIGKIINEVAKVILDKKPEIKKKLEKLFPLKGNIGALILSLINFSTQNLSGEDLIEAGLDIIRPIIGIINGQNLDLSIEIPVKFTDSIPKIIGGLIGGESLLEETIKALIGNPEDITKLVIKFISTIWFLFKKYIEKNLDSLVQNSGFQNTQLISKSKEYLMNLFGILQGIA